MNKQTKQVKSGKGLEIGLLISLLVVFSLILLILGINLSQGGIWVLEGLDGEPGLPGAPGIDGTNGKSAYELAVQNGYQGTLHEWLVSLAVPGADGKDGTAIRDVKVDEDGNLIVWLTNGTRLNAGYVGNSGFSSEVIDAHGFTEVYETVLMNNEASQLNLREEPTTNSKVLAVITSGTEVLRIGYNKTTGWCRLVHNGSVCYANAKYFDLKYSYKGDVPEIHLPSEITLVAGVESWFVTDAILADAGEEFSLSFSYSGEGTRVYDGNAAFAITPDAPGNAVLTVALEKRDEGEWRVLNEKQIRVTVVEAAKDLALTGIVLGDSRISDSTIVTKLQTDMQNLTLLGTRKTENYGIAHEGRGAWSTANYLKSPSVTLKGSDPVSNPFYNPDLKRFDFSYYMAQNYPGTKLDFVVINLGANDGFTQGSVENLTQMVDSIKDYAKKNSQEIAVIVMTEYLSPSTGYFLSQSSNLDIAAMRGKQFRYFTYLEKAFANREDEGIYLLPNYICIDNWSDRYRGKVFTTLGEKEMITDVIHLGRNGYLKEAAMIEAYLFDIFN
ncbi:MAG: SGNH/GDSL hydrolase family protein [Clostridia bacterium]|nr:SGNH/GDSL hydrolase family protein [Clostridia bacterium]